MADRFDVVIIGTGPAGLSAAITLKIRNKNILVLGSKESSVKVTKAHEINNYLGLPKISGSELGKNMLEHADQMGVVITEDYVTNVYAMGDYFSLTTRSNVTYEAKTVIIATGVNFGKPYEGEEKYLGRGVSYCATCDAPLYKGKTVAIIGSSVKEEQEVKFMSEICEKVYYIPLYKMDDQKNISDMSDMSDEASSKTMLSAASVDIKGSVLDGIENVELVYDVPMAIEGRMKAEKLVLKERELVVDGTFILRESISPAQLVPGLSMDGNHIAVNRRMETNLAGLFACGDIVGTPYQYIKAAGEGNVAAISCVDYLNKQ